MKGRGITQTVISLSTRSPTPLLVEFSSVVGGHPCNPSESVQHPLRSRHLDIAG
jgi:hypothetical protein